MPESLYCPKCGAHTQAARKVRLAPYPDLPAISVETGFQTCPACQSVTTSYRAMMPMVNTIGEALVAKPGALTPDEARFLTDLEMQSSQPVSIEATPLRAVLKRSGKTWRVA